MTPSVLSTVSASGGALAVFLGRARVGYLVAADEDWMWEVTVRSDAARGHPRGRGTREECERRFLGVLRAWLSACGAPTEWTQSITWESRR
jgi:hypothetical protein